MRRRGCMQVDRPPSTHDTYRKTSTLSDSPSSGSENTWASSSHLIRRTWSTPSRHSTAPARRRRGTDLSRMRRAGLASEVDGARNLSRVFSGGRRRDGAGRLYPETSAVRRPPDPDAAGRISGCRFPRAKSTSNSLRWACRCIWTPCASNRNSTRSASAAIRKQAAQMLVSAGWNTWLVPFYFRVLHPARFLRNIVYSAHHATTSDWRSNLDGGQRIRVLGRPCLSGRRKPHGRRRMSRMSPSEEAGFGQWADEIWRAAQVGLLSGRGPRCHDPQHPLSRRPTHVDSPESHLQRPGCRLGRRAERAHARSQLLWRHARWLADRLPGVAGMEDKVTVGRSAFSEVPWRGHRGDEPVASSLAGCARSRRVVSGASRTSSLPPRNRSRPC